VEDADSTYFVPGPVWILELKVAGMVSYAAGRTAKARYLFVFTELLHAERFRDAGQASNHSPRIIPSEKAYADFLESVQTGYDRVAYDPSFDGKIKVSFPLGEVIKDARANKWRGR
jgi:hypothetical protein